jgi:hypothetical protein
MARASGIVVAVVVAGCGSSDPPPAIEAHPAPFAHALCGTLFRCCSLPGDRQLARWSGTPPDQAFCEDAIAQSLTDRAPHLQESLSSGRISYSEADTRSCVAALEKVKCEDFSWSNAYPTRGCWAVTGRVRTGEGCVDNFECAAGTCNAAPGSIGKCVSLPGAGERCSGICRPGLVCEGMCVPLARKTAGAGCSGNIDCISRLCGPQGDGAALTCAPVQACGFFP